MNDDFMGLLMVSLLPDPVRNDIMFEIWNYTYQVPNMV